MYPSVSHGNKDGLYCASWLASKSAGLLTGCVGHGYVFQNSSESSGMFMVCKQDLGCTYRRIPLKATRTDCS